MSLIKGLPRRRFAAVTLIVACLTVGGVIFWHASNPLGAKANAIETPSTDEQNLQQRLQKGVGSEVRFASTAKPEQIDEAVASTAEFIYWRSGLKLSDETKKRLVKVETKALKGEGKLISVEKLSDTLTETVVDRLATLTDPDIEVATEASSDDSGQVQVRANGKWGVLTKKELIQQAKAGRESSQQGDSALHSALRVMVEQEVNERVNALGTALPEQFGQARAKGLTPSQALLVAYSVAADDPLTDSRSDIEQTILQKRMDARQTRKQKQAQKDVSGRPYGPKGFVHPSAPHLFFNRTNVNRLLNLSEGGTN